MQNVLGGYQDIRTSGIRLFVFVLPDILVTGIPCLRQALIAWSPDSLQLLVSNLGLQI